MQSSLQHKPKQSLSNSNLLFIIAGVIFVLMYGFAILNFPGSFLQFQTFFDLFSLNAPLIILTLGMSIVMIGGGIDISVGAVCGLVTMSCAVFLESRMGSVGGALLLALKKLHGLALQRPQEPRRLLLQASLCGRGVEWRLG